MEDPVLMPDGHTYERQAITEALSFSPFSPITRQPMKIEDAVPNYALKSLIEQYMSEKRVQPAAVSNIEPITIENFEALTFPDPVNSNNSLLCVNVKPTPINSRFPLSLIAMVDLSSSMDEDCSNVKGLEELSLTRLQLVQHSLKTIISSLSDNDEITLITFDSTARIHLQTTQLTSSGKEATIHAIESMHPSGLTNIYGALCLGIERAQSLQGQSKNVSLMLFTDGEPNVNPPLGIIPSLQDTLSGTNMQYSISTFGFGYSLDSELLEAIANIGHGIYGYCPDCTIVGTTFINYVSSLLTILSKASLHVTAPSIDQTLDCTLYNGSSRHFVIPIPNASLNNIDLSQINVVINVNGTLSEASVKQASSETELALVRDQYWRFRLLQILTDGLDNLLARRERSEKNVESLFEEIAAQNEPSKFMGSLMIDLMSESQNHGQIHKGFSKEYFQKWGKDYLRSFMLCHKNEVCGNFMDESLQFYTSPQFLENRTKANRLFSEIPPPEPKPKPIDQRTPTYHACANPTDQFACTKHKKSNYHESSMMSRINNRFAGCFGGESLVKMNDGQVKKIKDLRKGDVVENGAIVECLVRIRLPEGDNLVEAVTINGALFTPWHPVKIDGNWVFPAEIKETEKTHLEAWYNLVLQGEMKTVVVNGVEAVTLGHGMTGKVVEHPYFGTNRVIESLKRKPGYDDGFVDTEGKQPVRDESGLISEYF